ncbi:hypothetical protein [Allosphingosinicella sp.]|uniref:hypothetical protein n=1 Tax=Allosphingosinicella sp. TaxID=2823234 RepID=UPI002FC0B66E
MNKPPKAPPHSDLDGVGEDEKNNVDAAVESGQGTGDLAKAKEKSVGRPPYSTDRKVRDDRADRGKPAC